VDTSSLPLTTPIMTLPHRFGHGPRVKGREPRNRTAFPDLRLTIEDLIAKAIPSWPLVLSRHHKGDLNGMAPTGKQFTISGVTIARLLNGSLRKATQLWDAFGDDASSSASVPQLAAKAQAAAAYLQLHKVTLPTLPNQPEGPTTRRAFLQISVAPSFPTSCRKAWEFSLLSSLFSNFEFLVSFYPARSSPSAPASSSSKKKRLDSHSSRPLHVAATSTSPFFGQHRMPA